MRVYPYNEILFNNNTKWNTETCYNLMNLKKHAKGKKIDMKVLISCDFIYIKCLQMANLQIQKAEQWLPETGGQEQKLTTNSLEEIFGSNLNGLKLDCCDSCTTTDLQVIIKVYSYNG